MRDPNLKALTVYVDKSVYELVQRAADEDGRSVTNFVARLIGRQVMGPVQTVSNNTNRQTIGDLARKGVQVDLVTQIARAVKRGPVRKAK